MASEKRYWRQLARNGRLFPHPASPPGRSVVGNAPLPILLRFMWRVNNDPRKETLMPKLARSDQTAFDLNLIPAASFVRDIVCKLFYILVQKRFTKQLGTLTRCKAQWRRVKTGDNPTGRAHTYLHAGCLTLWGSSLFKSLSGWSSHVLRTENFKTSSELCPFLQGKYLHWKIFAGAPMRFRPFPFPNSLPLQPVEKKGGGEDRLICSFTLRSQQTYLEEKTG